MFALLALLATPSASPSPSPSPTPPVIASVRVATGSAESLHRLPVAASALSVRQIRASSAVTTDAVLRELPGFDRTRSNSMFTNYGQLRVSFAGAGNDRGLVLLDGIPVQDGFGGQVDWATIPVGDLAQAELLLGAGSALYGSGASTGVLSLRTRALPAASLPIGADVAIEAGTGANSQENLYVQGAPSARFGAALMLQQQRLAYDALAPAYRSPNSGTSTSYAAAGTVRARYAFDTNDEVQIGERNAWDDQDEGRPNYTFARHFAQTDLRYLHSTLQSALQAIAYGRNDLVYNTADKFPSAPGSLLYVQNVPTSDSGESLTWTVSSGVSTFVARVEGRHVTGAVTQYAASGAIQSASAGVQNLDGTALQETWRSRRFEAIAGARFDEIDSTGTGLAQRADAISPRIAVRYDASPVFALRISSGSGLRAPYLNELLRGYFIGGVTYLPNRSLVPERSTTTSAGADLLQSATHVSLDVFRTTVNDAIMFRTLSATRQQRSNVAQTKTDAYVLNVSRALGGCSRLSGWVSQNDAHVSAGPAAIAGRRLQYVPASAASLAYDGRFGIVEGGVNVSYTGQTYADDLNAQPLGSALLAGFHAIVPFRDFALELRADNLTGTRYLSSIDRYGPPALLSVGLRLPIGAGANRQEQRCSSPAS